MALEVIYIPHNRLKLFIYGLFSLVFLALSVWLVLFSIFLLPLSLLGILFFSLAGFSLLQKSLEKDAGLKLLKEGILDTSNFVSIGLILRRDIQDIHLLKVQNQDFIQIMLQNPQDYIAKGNRIQQFWMKLNYKTYGTPISISLNFLKIKQVKLEELLQNYLK